MFPFRPKSPRINDAARVLTADLADTLHEYTGQSLDSEQAAKWLSGSTAEQVSAIRDLIEEIPSMSDGMLHIVNYIIYPLDVNKRGRTDGYTAIHDALALRNAFYGPIIKNQRQFRFNLFSELVLGLRGKSGSPLDLHDPEKKRGYEALLSFQFEMSAYASDIPNYQKRYIIGRGHDAAGGISDAKLKQLILNNVDRIDELIQYASSRPTVDAALLELMMRENVSPALNEGML
jgi:hypothetical protein